MFEQLKDIISQELNIQKDKIKLESRLSEDLGLDSIDAVELIMKLEEDYNISISDDEIKNVKTVRELVDYVNKLVK